MPVSEIHKKKLSKNLAVLLAIFVFCALVFGVTMAKLARADGHGSMLTNMDGEEMSSEMSSDHEMEHGGMKEMVSSGEEHELNQAYRNERTEHQAGIDSITDQYHSEGEAHQADVSARPEAWFSNYENTALGK